MVLIEAEKCLHAMESEKILLAASQVDDARKGGILQGRA